MLLQVKYSNPVLYSLHGILHCYSSFKKRQKMRKNQPGDIQKYNMLILKHF